MPDPIDVEPEEPLLHASEADAGDQMEWPMALIPLPFMYQVESRKAEDGTPLVVIAMFHCGGGLFGSATREDALAFASRIRKAAQTGPTEETD